MKGQCPSNVPHPPMDHSWYDEQSYGGLQDPVQTTMTEVRFHMMTDAEDRRNLSCGVVLIDVERCDLIECNASGSTISQCESGKECVFSARRTLFHTIPLYRLH